MKTALVLAACAFMLSGCVTSPADKQAWQYQNVESYKMMLPEAMPKTKSYAFDVALTDGFDIKFKIQNKSETPIKIIWDESSVILPDGSAKRVYPTGTKYIDATREHAPTIIPAQASVTTGLSRSDNLTFSSRWVQGPLLPCGTSLEALNTGCDPRAYDGKFLDVIVAIEQNGKRQDARLKFKATANPAASAIIEQYRIDHAPKPSPAPTSPSST